MRAITTLVILFVILRSESTRRFCPPARNKLLCVCYEETREVSMFCYIDDINKLCKLNCGSYVPYLRHLTIVLNDITTLPSSLLAFRNLNSLEISGDVLRLIEDRAFEGLESKLELLRMNNTYLQQIPAAAMMNLTKLAILNLDGNQITSVEQSVGRLPLHHLYLSGNMISRVEQGMLSPMLGSLDLSNNILSSLNGSLKGGRSRLWQLNISKNFVVSLAGELTKVCTLRYLIAEWNDIKTIDDGSLSTLNELEGLYLAHNHIYQLVEGLKRLKSLVVLDLSYNGLTHIGATAFNELIVLQELNLEHNCINYLEQNLLDCLSSLEKLYISQNRLFDLNFLLPPPSAIDPNSANIDTENLDEHNGRTCAIRESTTLKSLTMSDSGVICDYEVNQIINDLKSNGVDIKGNPCERNE